jgi:predicted nucleotidyltransferase
MKSTTANRITLDSILTILREAKPELRSRYSVTYLGVFGSYVRGEHRPTSDVDVLVEFDQAPTIFRFLELRRHLATLLGVKVDLVMKKTLKPYIGKRILAEVISV